MAGLSATYWMYLISWPAASSAAISAISSCNGLQYRRNQRGLLKSCQPALPAKMQWRKRNGMAIRQQLSWRPGVMRLWQLAHQLWRRKRSSKINVAACKLANRWPGSGYVAVAKYWPKCSLAQPQPI